MESAIEFYQKNLHFIPRTEPIPDRISDDDLVHWLFKQNLAYIDIDLTFDISDWYEEAQKSRPFLVNHRENQNHQGWRSCCIHGIDVDKTGVWQCYADVEPEYQWTELSESTPIIKKFWQQFPFEKLARVRFMELAPGGFIDPHNDSPKGFDRDFDLLEHLIPINVAIDHPDNCYMTLKNHGVIPWQTGDIKLVNITNDHSVINFSNQPRMHMIAHGIIGNRKKEFYQLIAKSYRKQNERYRI